MHGIKIENALIIPKQTKNQKRKEKKKVKKEKVKKEKQQQQQQQILDANPALISSKNERVEPLRKKIRSYSYATEEKAGPYMYRYLSLNNYMCETEEIIYNNTKPKDETSQNAKTVTKATKEK